MASNSFRSIAVCISMSFLAMVAASCASSGPSGPADATLASSDAPSASTRAASPSATAPASASPSASAPPSAVPGAIELSGSPATLPAGTYTYSPFRPAITFRLDGSWTSVNRFDDIFDVEQDVGSPDVIAVQFARPGGLVGAAAVPAPNDPGDAVAILKSNRALTVAKDGESRIGGLVGRVVEISNTSGAHVSVMTVGPGALGIDSGRRLWIAFFATPDGLVAVMVGGSVARWQAALDAAEPVLESIRFPELGTGG